MALTRRERIAQWKSRTSETAAALKKAKATVTLSGKRTIPLTARTAKEIRVAAWRAEHPDRTVVEYEDKKDKKIKPTAKEEELDRQRRLFAQIERNLEDQKRRTVPPPATQAYIQPGAITAEPTFVLGQTGTGLPLIQKEETRGGLAGLYDIMGDPIEVTREAEKLKEMHTGGPSKTTKAILDTTAKISSLITTEKDILKAYGPQATETTLMLGTIDSLIRMAGGVPRGAEIVSQTPEAIIPGAIITGHQMTVGTAVGLVEDPAQAINDIVMISALVGAPGRTWRTISGGTKGKIAAEAIIEPEILAGTRKFPVTGRPGVTSDAAINRFLESEYKIRTAIEKGEVEPPLTSKLTGRSEKFLDTVKKIDAEVSGWHATQQGFGKTTIAQVGTSSTPGLHVAPSLSPHFLGAKGELALFGMRKGGRPTALSIEVKGFDRIPNISRRTVNDMNKFLIETAKESDGIAYITSKYEALSKKASVEYEAVLPPGTPLVKVAAKLETVYKGKTVSVEQYKAVFIEDIKTDIKNFTTLEKLYSERTGKRAIISQYEATAAGISSIARSSISRGSTARSIISDISNISRAASLISSVSKPVYPSRVVSRYTTPPRPSRPTPSTYSSKYTSNVASYIRSFTGEISKASKPIPMIRPPPIIPPKKKIKTVGKKKVRKVKKGVRAAFVRNPIPSIEAFMK